VLRSLSRVAPDCYRDDERPLVERARRLMRLHADTAELIQLGAYRQGSDALIDEAIRVRPALEALLAQGTGERSTIDEDIDRLAAALGAGQPASVG
jgi:flagellum-specific ATP synthase